MKPAPFLPPSSRSFRPRVRARRGMSVLIVIMLISVAMALSYAVVRTQGTAIRIQQNARLRADARQAALSGMAVALKNIQSGDWAGIDTTLVRTLGDNERFEVTFATGDASLQSGDSDYAEYPYRVTLLSTGYAEDPADSSRVATHQVQAVVRLVPRKLADEPSDWATMQGYTVYQSKKDSFEVDIPCRLEGPVRIQGTLKIGTHYPSDDDSWSRYLQDLNAMRSNGYPDYRPFNGPVHLPFCEQDAQYLLGLSIKLGVISLDTPVDETAGDWTKPTSLASYQLYPGGAEYTIPSVGGTLQEITLEADPLTNPVGLFYYNSSVTVKDNVTIRGSLFCKDDIRIEGTGVQFDPVELPGLYGSDAPVRLPAVSCQKFIVKPSGGGSLTGLIAVFEEFRVDKSPDTVSFVVTGRVIARKFFIEERQPWEALDWEDFYDDFEEQLEAEEGPVVPYFPVWMGNQGRDPKPLLITKPDPTPVTYHWRNPGDPIFVPHPDDDGGLRWELLRWTEKP